MSIRISEISGVDDVDIPLLDNLVVGVGEKF